MFLFNGVLYTTLFSLVLANTINLTEIAIIGSASFLLLFFIVNISAYKLRKEINASPFILLISSTLTLLALATLMFHTYVSNPRAVVIFMTFIVISLLFELIYGRYIRGSLFNREY